MKQITIDVKRYGVNADGLTSDLHNAMQAALNTTLIVVRNEWMQQAQQELRSTRPIYLMGLQEKNSILASYNGKPLSGAIVLRGRLPNMLEEGTPAFDIKAAMPKSKRAKPTKSGGWYITIPIRHSTPNSFMYGKAMPPSVYDQVKKLQSRERLTVSGNERTSHTGYEHKANIYDGLTRIVKSYKPGTKQSQYMTFRRISDRSDPKSWIHPGFEGIHIVNKLESYAKEELGKNVRDAIQAINSRR